MALAQQAISSDQVTELKDVSQNINYSYNSP